MRVPRTIIATLVATLAAGPAAGTEQFHDEARVIATEPIYEARRIQAQECGYEPAGTAAPVDPDVPGDARASEPGIDLLGALHRDVQLREPAADVYRCRMVTRYESRQQLVGYRVRYEHAGRVFERRMAEPPGNTIRVAVRLSTGTGR